MHILRLIWAEFKHATHSIRHCLVGHRMVSISVKEPGQHFSRSIHVECECGIVFLDAENKR